VIVVERRVEVENGRRDIGIFFGWVYNGFNPPSLKLWRAKEEESASARAMARQEYKKLWETGGSLFV
jgi:hypothetical protein